MSRRVSPRVTGSRVADGDALARGLLLLGFALMLTYLMLTGQISAYLNPRFVPLTIFAAVCLALLGVVLVARGLERDALRLYRPVAWPLVVLFLVPLCLGLFVPPATMGAELAARQGLQLTGRDYDRIHSLDPISRISTWLYGLRRAQPVQQPPLAGEPAPAPEPPASVAAEDHAPPPPVPSGDWVPPASGVLQVTEQNFVDVIMLLYADPEALAGRELELTGFVLAFDGAAPDEFGVVRLIVTCHVAHAMPDGLAVIYPGAAEFADDDWVRVLGVLEMSEYRGMAVPKLRAERVERVERPVDPYIYPRI